MAKMLVSDELWGMIAPLIPQKPPHPTGSPADWWSEVGGSSVTTG